MWTVMDFVKLVFRPRKLLDKKLVFRPRKLLDYPQLPKRKIKNNGVNVNGLAGNNRTFFSQLKFRKNNRPEGRQSTYL